MDVLPGRRLWRQVAPSCRRPGLARACTDSELATMALVGECCGWDQETKLVSRWAARCDLVRLLTRSRRNEQRQVPAAVRRALNGVRQVAETVNGQLAEPFRIETAPF